MSVFAKSYSKEEKFLQQKFKERIADIKAHTQPVTKAPGPGDTKIPVTLSRVQNVQPQSSTWNICHLRPPLSDSHASSFKKKKKKKERIASFWGDMHLAVAYP